MSPEISANISDNNHTMSVTVYPPKRLIHHPSHSKFELRRYVCAAKPEGGEEIELGTVEATFREDPVQMLVTLPPQVQATKGEVRVRAEYEDGYVVYSKSDAIENWPHYGKASIRCTLRNSDCVLGL